MSQFVRQTNPNGPRESRVYSLWLQCGSVVLNHQPLGASQLSYLSKLTIRTLVPTKLNMYVYKTLMLFVTKKEDNIYEIHIYLNYVHDFPPIQNFISKPLLYTFFLVWVMDSIDNLLSKAFFLGATFDPSNLFMYIDHWHQSKISHYSRHNTPINLIKKKVCGVSTINFKDLKLKTMIIWLAWYFIFHF